MRGHFEGKRGLLMNIETKLKEKIQAAFQVMEVPLTLDQIIIERSKETVHGDFATNVAMQTARILRKSPLVIAQELVKHIDLEGIEKIEVVAPGFINFFLKSDTLSALIKTIITQGETFGTSKHGVGQRINVEFVSANPTGDLHIGHARGAALGDSICRLYEAVGYEVTRDFYVNDAGVQ
ncbi:MAG: arginine--tRNA ligase, partial [Methanomicrobia archaeon]|nr:arginine--tRNA ligase [Methanomicrobia archaeon]